MTDIIPRKIRLQTLVAECPTCGMAYIWLLQDLKKKEVTCKCGFRGDIDDWPYDEDAVYIITITDESATIEETE